MHKPAIVIDGHCHLASSKCIPMAFFEGVAHNVAQVMLSMGQRGDVKQIATLMALKHTDHDGSDLVAQMNEAGFDKTVLLAPDFTFALESEVSIEEIAEHHKMVRDKHPGRFFVFQGVDPRWGDRGLELLEKCFRDYGFSGLKLYPPCGYSPSDELLFPFYDLCRQYGAPVLLHTGPTSPALRFDYASPSLIDGAARAFPDVNFILAHGGVNNVDESVLLCKYRGNVFLDISAFPSTTDARGWLAALSELFSRGINHKIIFGTDWPVATLSSGLGGLMNTFYGEDGPLASVRESDRQLIMRGNIMRLIPHSL